MKSIAMGIGTILGLFIVILWMAVSQTQNRVKRLEMTVFPTIPASGVYSDSVIKSILTDVDWDCIPTYEEVQKMVDSGIVKPQQKDDTGITYYINGRPYTIPVNKLKK